MALCWRDRSDGHMKWQVFLAIQGDGSAMSLHVLLRICRFLCWLRFWYLRHDRAFSKNLPVWTFMRRNTCRREEVTVLIYALKRMASFRTFHGWVPGIWNFSWLHCVHVILCIECCKLIELRPHFRLAQVLRNSTHIVYKLKLDNILWILWRIFFRFWIYLWYYIY